jgi:hypothetical protein
MKIISCLIEQKSIPLQKMNENIMMNKAKNNRQARK